MSKLFTFECYQPLRLLVCKTIVLLVNEELLRYSISIHLAPATTEPYLKNPPNFTTRTLRGVLRIAFEVKLTFAVELPPLVVKSVGYFVPNHPSNRTVGHIPAK